MLLNFSCVEEFWNYIIRISCDIIKTEIPPDPWIWIWGDTLSLNVSYNIKYSTDVLCLEKSVFCHTGRLSFLPSQRQWLHEFASYGTPEKILLNMKKPAPYEKPSLRPLATKTV